ASWRTMPAQAITRRQVRDLLDTIAERAPIQANRVLALLRKVWNFGIKRDLVETNPCALLDRPAPEHQRERVLTADERRAPWKAVEQDDPQASELGVSRLVVSKLLNHVETGVTKVYDRASYDREKRTALNAWAAKLEQIVSGEPARAKVIPLVRA